MKRFKVIKEMPGEWVNVGDIFEIVSRDAAFIWIRLADGSMTIKSKFLNNQYVEAI